MLSSTIFSKPKQKVIKIVFKAENVNQIEKLCYRNFTYENIQKFIQQKTQALNLDKQKVSRFVRDGQKYIKFQKGKCDQILQRDQVILEFLYTKKRDELEKKIAKFSQIVQKKFIEIKEINDEYKEGSNKVMILRKLVSSQTTTISQNLEQKNQINITLLISDPLVKQSKNNGEKIQGAGFQGLDLQDHVKKLQQGSVSSKSLKIQINKKIAFYDKIYSFFPKLIAFSTTKIVRIVTFFTKITRQADNQLYISFQNQKLMGQQKLVKAEIFFNETVYQLNIEAMLIIGVNANLLTKYKAPFTVILISTYSFIVDKGMRCFVQNFYLHIFQKKQIQESFNLALIHYKKLFYQTNYQNQFLCCCLHEHKINCSWYKIIDKVGIPLAHKIFNHQNVRSNENYNILQPLQQIILGNKQQKCCSSMSQRCCMPEHIGKTMILKKISFINPNQKQALWDNQQDSEFIQQKNKFQKKDSFQKITSVRRCPVITFNIIQKILNGKQKEIITFVGNKKVGKGYLIQASRLYIEQRSKYYAFEYVQFTQSSLQKQLSNMFKIAKQKKTECKNVVFIHNNYSISFEAEFFKKIKQKKKGKNLPFTILIKIIKPEIQYNNQQRGSPIIIDKLSKIELLAEILYELSFKQFKSQQQIRQIQRFCQENKEKLTYKTIRNFLKYFKQKQTSSLLKNKSLLQEYNLINMQFKQRMLDIYKKSPMFYDFIGFLAQFQEGVYLIKLNSLILSEFFQINEIKKHLNNRQNTFNILDISTTLIRSKDGAKSQQILFILPEQSVVNYFNECQQKSKYIILKYKYFYCLFQILWKIVKENRKLLLQKMKITSDIFFDGVFMLEIEAKYMIKNENQMIEKTSKSIIHFYSEKYKVIQHNEFKKRRKNSLQNNMKIKKQLIGQKMLRLLFGQIQKYILHHHSTNFSNMIENYGNLLQEHESKKNIQKLKNEISQKQFIDKQLLCRLSLIIICKKVLIIYDIVLKQSFDYQSLKSNIKNCVKHLQEDLTHKKILNTQIKHKKLDQLKKSFSNLEYKKELTKQQFYSKDEYFSQLICLIQLQILLKVKITSLPKIQIHSKSEQYLPSLKQIQENQTLSKEQICHQSFVPDQQFQIMEILNKLVNYEKNKLQINKSRKNNYETISVDQIQQIVVKIQQSISFITDLLDMLKIFNVNIYPYLSSLTEDKLITQVLRLLMDKVKIHYQIYEENKSSFKKLLPRSNYKLRQLNYLLNQYYKHLWSMHQDKSKNCFKNEQITIFLKNVLLCKKYMNFVLQNDKTDFDLQSLGDNVYEQYQKIFYFLKEKTCKKVIFNSQNLIVFMKSRVMMFRNSPYVFIRKRNVTMKYVKKILHKRDVKISFFALNRGNFSLLQIDSNNKKCQIYYLVLTVDTIIQNGQLKLLFQQAQSIHQDLVSLSQFVDKVNKMNIVFLLITGKNSKPLCQQLKNRLQNPPIIIALQNNQYSLKNYVPYINENVIQQEDEFLTQNSLSIQQNHVNQISKYMDIQIYHSMLDLVICSIISLLTQMADQNCGQLEQSMQNTGQQHNVSNLNLHKQVNNIVYKSIRRAKDILWPIWYGVEQEQLEIQYKIFIKNQEYNQSLHNTPLNLDRATTFPTERTFSNEKQQQLKSKYSISSQLNRSQQKKNIPQIKKGELKDLNNKIHQSPNNLIDQKYYQNVGRHLQVCYIIQHLKEKGNKVALIEGDKKSGKTNLANQICWISQTRRLFKDGVYQYDMRQLRNCMFTIPEYIQVHHLQQKLYNILKHSQLKDQEESSFLVSFQNLSKLDLNEKQNLQFFLNLNKKAVSLLITTNEEDLLQELQKHLSIQVHILKKKNESNQVRIVRESKNKHMQQHFQNLNESHHKHHNQKWSLLKVNINKISKDELFCIALSYLKRKQVYDKINDLKQFISKSYAKSIINLMKQIDQKEQENISQPKLNHTRSNQSHSLSQQFEKTLQFDHLRREKSYHQGRTKSAQTINKLPKLFKKLQEQLNITNKEDTRISFYQECFQQLLSQNKTYNQLSVSFK